MGVFNRLKREREVNATSDVNTPPVNENTRNVTIDTINGTEDQEKLEKARRNATDFSVFSS